MFRALSTQTSGSILVFSSFALAEVAVRLLDTFPASRIVWYTNLAVFAPFERCRAVPSPLGAFIGPGTLSLSLILIGLALTAHVVRFRLAVAAISHLSLAASAWLAYAWSADDILGQVSVTTLRTREGLGSCLVLVMLGVSSVGCALGHHSYARAIRSYAAAPKRSRAVAVGNRIRGQRHSQNRCFSAIQII